MNFFMQNSLYLFRDNFNIWEVGSNYLSIYWTLFDIILSYRLWFEFIILKLMFQLQSHKLEIFYIAVKSKFNKINENWSTILIRARQCTGSFSTTNLLQLKILSMIKMVGVMWRPFKSSAGVLKTNIK